MTHIKVYKPHISEDFEKGLSPLSPNGAGKGATVFLDYDKMIKYLNCDGREWHICEILVKRDELRFDFKNDWMATILVDKLSQNGYRKLNI